MNQLPRDKQIEIIAAALDGAIPETRGKRHGPFTVIEGGRE
jgi:hypothetical protein